MLSKAMHLYHDQHRLFGRGGHAPSHRPDTCTCARCKCVLREGDTNKIYPRINSRIFGLSAALQASASPKV